MELKTVEKAERREESILIGLFGNTSFTKVLDTLMDHPNYDYTKKQLAEVNDLSRPTLYKIWPRLERFKIVQPTRKIGNTQLYKLNTESALVKELYRLEQKAAEEV
ncbi:MAG: hypothetical protein SVV03_02350 [Candidatus Nanohaloarchaea archaeon]|nr:hypothetical protein [Candidatus Nanohaloarchaea archaeon]